MTDRLTRRSGGKTVLSFPGPSAAVVVAGGDDPGPGVLDEIPTPAFVVAADSGLDHALRLGLGVDVLVGDLDSVSEEALATFAGPVVRYPAEKDATDLELALDLVAGRASIDRVVVVGGLGGRIDHLLATAGLVAAERYAHLDVVWLAGTARVSVIHLQRTLHGSPGETVTLLPVGGPAGQVTTRGLRWELAGDILTPGQTRGVSNVFLGAVATVRVGSGTLLAIQPESRA